MILYQLICANEHTFDSWFRDSAAYDRMAAVGGMECPHCGSTDVRKALMAPNIARGSRPAREAAAPPAEAAVPPAAQPGQPSARLPTNARDPEKVAEFHKRMSEVLTKLQRTVEEHCDYVGDRFAEEARKIHYGETEARGIYGETTPEEADDLREEGVEFAAIPWRRPVS